MPSLQVYPGNSKRESFMHLTFFRYPVEHWDYHVAMAHTSLRLDLIYPLNTAPNTPTSTRGHTPPSLADQASNTVPLSVESNSFVRLLTSTADLNWSTLPTKVRRHFLTPPPATTLITFSLSWSSTGRFFSRCALPESIVSISSSLLPQATMQHSRCGSSNERKWWYSELPL